MCEREICRENVKIEILFYKSGKTDEKEILVKELF